MDVLGLHGDLLALAARELEAVSFVRDPEVYHRGLAPVQLRSALQILDLDHGADLEAHRGPL
jgi:hypothetical protein